MMILLALACGNPPDPAGSAAPEEDALDLRLSEGDYDAPAGADVWTGPEVFVQPGEDKTFCLFGTYSGPDVGVHALTTWQNAYGHHLVLMGTTASDLDYPDGTVIDCTETGSLDMTAIEPMVLPTGVYVGGEPRGTDIALADGMAVKLDEGQRWVVQSHYINTGAEPFRARDVAVLEYLPEDEVETWAAPLAMNHGAFSIPPGESLTVRFDCAFGTEWNVLYTLGHLHEWGTAIRLEQVQGDAVTTVFDVAEWEPAYRDAPPTFRYQAGEYVLPADATLRTTCSWFNDTDAPIEFPHEMCVSVAMVYPQTTAAICDYDPASP